jgi:hypothetical protein
MRRPVIDTGIPQVPAEVREWVRSTIPLRVGPCRVTSHAGRTHIIYPAGDQIQASAYTDLGLLKSIVRPRSTFSATTTMASNLRAVCQTCTFRFFRALLSLSLNIPLFIEHLPRFILKHAIFPGKKLYPEVLSNPAPPSTKMSSLITQHSSIHSKAIDNHDPSLKYAQNKTSVNNANPTRVDLQALRRKIDWRIVPIMFLCYTVQFLDKVNINVFSHLHYQY